MSDNSAGLPPAPPEASPRLLRLAQRARKPLDRFLAIEAASGILLLLAALFAFACANSRWAAGYLAFWHTAVGIQIGAIRFERSLEWCVNDGLMVIFFFVVGLEIRREVHHGELSELKRAALPAVAALGGMLAPAGLYLSVAGAPATHAGWGVPMATDIAFAVGILSLLGNRASPALRVLLLALAVIDDLGAILVIALFYSDGVAASALCVALLGVGGVFAMQRFGVRNKLAYIAPGLVVWGGVYASGVHPTIAGVVIGLITPVRAWLGPEGFVSSARADLEQLAQGDHDARTAHELAVTLRHVDAARREALSPAESLIETLHPWVAFGIMPLFALANAGVALGDAALEGNALSVAIGVGLGLVVGKPIGVVLACWLSLRLGIAALPAGVGSKQLLVLGVVAGIGFTMALFVAQLAFVDPQLLAAAKLGVLCASVAAGLLGLALGRVLLSAEPTPNAAQSADEAERATEL